MGTRELWVLDTCNHRMIFCIHDIYNDIMNVHLKGNLYWSTIMWIVCETHTCMDIHSCPWSDLMTSTCIGWWLCFTSHRTLDVTNNVGRMWDMCLDWPNRENTGTHIYATVYAMSLNLSLTHILGMWNVLLRGYQTLLRNRVVIKVAFGFDWKHAASNG